MKSYTFKLSDKVMEELAKLGYVVGKTDAPPVEALVEALSNSVKAEPEKKAEPDPEAAKKKETLTDFIDGWLRDMGKEPCNCPVCVARRAKAEDKQQCGECGSLVDPNSDACPICGASDPFGVELKANIQMLNAMLNAAQKLADRVPLESKNRRDLLKASDRIERVMVRLQREYDQIGDDV